tara:strand:+ start:263 stop:1336 length:1074 start_codon:yes stop_codon:yes gene_type:complete
MPIKYSTEDILQQFKEAHGDKYDYSKVKYIKGVDPVIIICPIHGEFPQTPRHHKKGFGCRKCGIEIVRLSQTNDLTDKKFGKLRVIRKISTEEKKALGIKWTSAYWEVQCACGRKPFIIVGSQLTNKNKSGRNNKPVPQRWACKVCTDRAVKLKQKEETFAKIKNQKFNLLTVVREWGSDKDSKMRLLCFCDCGRTKINKIDHLKGGDVKSCGCLDIGEDSHSYFKRHPEYADSDCFFYIAELDNEHLKVGISNDLKVRKRGSHGNYREYLFKRKLNRSECWTIEQIILHETLDAKPSTTPKKFKNMKGGKQEIRIKNKYSLNFYRNKYFELLEKMTELGGWEDLYLNRFNYKKKEY